MFFRYSIYICIELKVMNLKKFQELIEEYAHSKPSTTSKHHALAEFSKLVVVAGLMLVSVALSVSDVVFQEIKYRFNIKSKLFLYMNVCYGNIDVVQNIIKNTDINDHAIEYNVVPADNILLRTLTNNDYEMFKIIYENFKHKIPEETIVEVDLNKVMLKDLAIYNSYKEKYLIEKDIGVKPINDKSKTVKI